MQGKIEFPRSVRLVSARFTKIVPSVSAKRGIVLFAFVALLSNCVFLPGQTSQKPVQIEVDADQPAGSIPPVWNFFGYDEPNYTYAPNGQKLLGELAALTPQPVYVRVHNLFTTGDGSPSLKWGSTNVYTEENGRPVYSWKIVDRIFDTFHGAGIKPLVEIGFMPEALSTHPQPYRHSFPNGSIFTGWAYPPTDYQKWAELVFQFVRHLRDRYGEADVHTWLWEVWNEPDIDYWKGTQEEFFELYDFSADAVLRALPGAKIGGPDSTGPASPKAAEFLRAFLDHCAHGKNYATHRSGAPLDFISFHPKGSPQWRGDHVQMGISRQLSAIDEGFKIVASFPEWRNTPVVLGESDPEGCAACSAKQNPQNTYRNGPLYAAYTIEALHQTMALARVRKINLLGVVTWAFEFEDEPPFEGFRELATNGIDKPVLNAFRLLGLMEGERVKAHSSSGLATEEVVGSGVRAQADVNVIATHNGHEVSVLIWNYHDEDVSVPADVIELSVNGLGKNVDRAMVEQFAIDSSHSNAFAAWLRMGSPKALTSDQQRSLEAAGQLELSRSPEWLRIAGGELRLQITLQREAVTLVRISW